MAELDHSWTTELGATMAREFDTPEKGHARWETRCDFFRTLVRVDQTALPDFQKLYAKADHMTGAEFKAALNDWAKNRNILEPWVMETLKHTLTTWERGLGLGEFVNPGLHSTPSVPLIWRTLFYQEVAKAFDDFIGFEPTAETAECFSKRLDARYETFKADYIIKRSSEAQSKGYLPYVPRRQREAHLEWFIRYQVLEKSYNDVATDTYIEATDKSLKDETVRDAIKDIARFIGLILRE